MTATRKPGRSWKLFRIYFRRFRIGMWLVVLALLGSVLYVDHIGLPDFVKRPLLEKLRARGIDLQFTRLRLRFPHGLVADNVLIGQAGAATSPTLTLKEIQIRLDYAALARLQLQVNSLLLRQGQLRWPVLETNRPARALTVENIQTELRFLPGDLWELDQFQAQFAGANIQLSGTVTNASTLRDWKMFQHRPPTGQEPRPGELLQKKLHQLADALEQIHFSAAPELKVGLEGDALNLPGFGVGISLRAAGAEMPWGTFDQVVFLVRVHPPENRQPSHGEIILRAAGARTPWAAADDLDLTVHVLSEAATNFNADLTLTATRAKTEWGQATAPRFTAQWRHSSTNAIPLSGRGRLELATLATPWGAGRGLELTAALSTLPNAPVAPAPDLGWWGKLTPYALELTGQLSALDSSKVQATNLVCAITWEAPQFRINQLSAELYGGRLSALALLDVASRKFNFDSTSDCNVQKLPAWQTPAMQARFNQLSLSEPPELKLAAQFILPPWTNLNSQEFAGTNLDLRLLGGVAATNLVIRGVPFTSVTFHFSDTNQAWEVPDLRVARPEGFFQSSITYDEHTRDYFARLRSTLDVNVARLFIEPEQQRAFDLAEFTEPPEITAEVRGRVSEPGLLSVNGHLGLTNFAFRGQSASGFQSAIEFSNQVLTLNEPRLQHGDEHVSAEQVRVDLAAQKVFMTNVLGHANPLPFARAIGPVAGDWFEPYRFLGVPTARVNGSISFDINDGVDLHFDFEGGPFEWWKFKVPRIAGQVNWVNDTLTLDNVRADFYQGTAQGGAEFYFPRGADNRLRFDVAVTNADLHLLLGDLNSPTNRLKGLLTGRWFVTGGIPDQGETWKGYGQASLREGLLMEIPVFGVLTPALEGISPGLGSTRLSEAAATFVLTNGIIHSDDLDIRASGMRLQYRGDVDLSARVNARAEAELLRDTWVVGKMLSLALWPVSKVFEYKISGTLGDPKMEPLYFFPKLILMPLHPLDTMKELMAKPPEATDTNQPPAVLP